MLYFQKNNIKFYNNKHKLFSQTYNSIIFKFKILINIVFHVFTKKNITNYNTNWLLKGFFYPVVFFKKKKKKTFNALYNYRFFLKKKKKLIKKNKQACFLYNNLNIHFNFKRNGKTIKYVYKNYVNFFFKYLKKSLVYNNFFIFKFFKKKKKIFNKKLNLIFYNKRCGVFFFYPFFKNINNIVIKPKIIHKFTINSNTHLYDNSVLGFFLNNLKYKKNKQNNVFTIKPGFRVLWKKYRNLFKKGFQGLYNRDYNLTKYIITFFKVKSLDVINYYFFNVSFFFKNLFFFFYNNNNIYVNNILITSRNYQIYTNDFILIDSKLFNMSSVNMINYWYYLNLIKNNIFYKNYKKFKININYNLNYYFKLKKKKNKFDDFYKYVEFDFLTNTAYIIYEPWYFYINNNKLTFLNFFITYKLYNWKYINNLMLIPVLNLNIKKIPVTNNKIFFFYMYIDNKTNLFINLKKKKITKFKFKSFYFFYNISLMFLVFILLIKSNYMLNTYTVCNNNYLQFTFNFNLISFMYFKKKYINNDCRFFFKLKTFKYNYICKSLNISNNNLYFFIKNINKTDYKNNINILYNKNFKKQYYINNYKSNFIVNNCFDFKKKI